VLGLLAGILGALFLHLRDTAIRSGSGLEAITNAPTLGTITFDPEIRKQPLAMHYLPDTRQAESFRQLRANLQFTARTKPCKVVTIISSVFAEGKTTILCNLGVSLAQAGWRVLLVDADLRVPQVARVLGLDPDIGLTSVLLGKCEFERAVQRWDDVDLDVLASGPLPPNAAELLASDQANVLLGRLRTMYDFILIDSPPLLYFADAASVVTYSDGALLVVRYGKTTVAQAQAALSATAAVSGRVLGTVLSMVPNTGATKRVERYYKRRAVEATAESSDRTHSTT
jgi:capsular exopolysaccharide synthesis family protein